MTLFRSIGLIIFVALTAILVSGCTQKNEEEVVMRIGTNVWPGYEPLYLARSQGRLDDNNYRLIEYSNSTSVSTAFRNGLIDAAALTLDETLHLLHSGLNPKVILVMDISHGGDAVIAQNNIKSFKELKGLRVGIENNALGAYVMSRALDIHGMSGADIKPVSLTVDEHFRAFKEKRVEAVVTFEPVKSQLLQEGAQVVFDSRDIPGEIVDVLVVRKEFLDKYPSMVTKMLESWFETLKFMESDLFAASQIISKRQNLNPAAVEASYEGLILPDEGRNHTMLCDKRTFRDTVLKLNRVMHENGIVNGNGDIETLFDTSGISCLNKGR